MEFGLLQQGMNEHQIDCDILLYNKYCITPPEVIQKHKDKGKDKHDKD